MTFQMYHWANRWTTSINAFF